jgi:hypothetical protein
MALKVSKVDVWAGGMKDRPGELAANPTFALWGVQPPWRGGDAVFQGKVCTTR